MQGKVATFLPLTCTNTKTVVPKRFSVCPLSVLENFAELAQHFLDGDQRSPSRSWNIEIDNKTFIMCYEFLRFVYSAQVIRTRPTHRFALVDILKLMPCLALGIQGHCWLCESYFMVLDVT